MSKRFRPTMSSIEFLTCVRLFNGDDDKKCSVYMPLDRIDRLTIS